MGQISSSRAQKLPKQVIYRNPFEDLSELVEGLRKRFVAERQGQPMTPLAGEFVGKLAGLVTRCEHLRLALEELEGEEPATFEAFQRALEKWS